MLPGMRDQPAGAAARLILIADDNRDTREMHALYVSMLGYSVAVAMDGRIARSIAPLAPEGVMIESARAPPPSCSVAQSCGSIRFVPFQSRAQAQKRSAKHVA
jgi:hypothetical protein